MLLHNLKIAWRNLVKYKTQNIISILSLAVGIVCFATTLQVLKGVIADIYFSEMDTGTARFHVYKMTEEQYKNRKTLDENFADIQHADEELLDTKFITRLNSLEIPSMREIPFLSRGLATDIMYETENGEKRTLSTNISYCSPRHFHYKWYHSDITGERIPELSEGDILISDDIRDKVFGKGADPRGCIIHNPIDGKTATILDVVNCSERPSDIFGGAIYYISHTPQEHYRMYELPIELAPGATAAQLHKELSAAMPEYFFTYTVNDWDWGDEGIIFIVIMICTLLLGCSVLLIAVTGFLKMQVQLFLLRSRELALRRTMGAHPRQLIMLLSIEILIVFIFAGIASAGVTSFLVHYALPILHMINNKLNIDIDGVCYIQMWVIFVTLLITLIIASLIVYREVRRPVGIRVGRSGHPRTFGQSIMLSVQLAVSMILIMAVLGFFYLINDTIKHHSPLLPDNIAPYRRALIIDSKYMEFKIPDLRNKLLQLREIEQISNIVDFTCKTPVIDSKFVPRFITNKDSHGNTTSYSYKFTVSDEYIFEKLNIQISPECPTDEYLKERIAAVYVRTEEVERLLKKWNLTPSADTRTIPLYNERNYTLIGYVKPLPYYPFNSSYNHAPVFWIVDDDIDNKNFHIAGQKASFYHLSSYIIFPRKGKKEECKDAIAKLYREAQPMDRNEITINTLYDKWFTTMILMELIGKLVMLLASVSILCIVASVYSNISLESRAREKEVALRKIHGAKSRNVMQMFGSYYLRLLLAAAIFVAAIWFVIVSVINKFIEQLSMADWIVVTIYYLLSVFIVAFVTLATIGHKIYNVSKINAADVIKKE